MFLKKCFLDYPLGLISKLFKSDNFIIIIGVLSILPLIILSFFNNPNTDDFCYNVKTQDLGYWNAQVYCFNNWNGRFFTTAILTIENLVSGTFIIYKIIPVIILSLLFYSIYDLSSLLFINLKKRGHLVFVFYCLVMYLVQMPNISEGIYWLSGTINYQLANILTIFLCSFLIKLIQTNKRKYLVLSIIISVLITGLNEISMLLIIFLLGAIFIYKYLISKKINYSILIVLIFAIVSSIIVIKSPGNSIRGTNYPKSHQFFAIKQSIFAFKRNLEKWLPIIILFTYLYYDYFRKRVDIKQSEIFNVNLVFVAVIVLGILFIGFFTGFWAMGTVLPDRAINTVYFYFLIGFIYLTFVLFFKLKKENIDFISFSKWVKYSLLILVFIRLTDKGTVNNIRFAYSDLLSGRAYIYDLELKSRYELIKNCKLDTCNVPELTVIPYTIFSMDITNDSTHWSNHCYGSFHKTKKRIVKN